MKIDRNVEILITDYDFKGKGMGKIEGKPIFLNSGIIGDFVEVKLIQDKKSYFKGKIIRTITKSKDRVKSKCKYFAICGGCDFLEYPYEKQLEWKEEKVQNDIKRIAGINKKINSIVKNEKPYNYRNNIQLQVKDGEAGFYMKDSKTLVNIDKCEMASNAINAAIKILKNWNGLNSVDTISLRSNYKGEVMVVLITKNKVNKVNNLLKEVIDSNIVSIYENVNKKSKYRFSNEFTKLYGEDYLYDKIGELTFKLSPKSFFQINPYQVEKLYNIAIDFLEIHNDKVFDLYCGIGTLSLMAAQKGADVIGVEIVEDAIEDARENAKINNLEARFIVGKSEEIIEKLIEDEKIYPDKVILDPPRAGLDDKLINKLLEVKPEKMAYISCNPSTQARDLKILKEKYEIVEITPVDMFSNTVHVETVALLSKLNVDKHISVEVELDELDLTSAESKATYAQIKEYILEKFGLKVSALYIAQIKKKCGIELRENYNKSKKEKQIIPQCTPEKEEAIMDALRHFKMI